MDYKRNTRVSTLIMTTVLTVFTVLKLCRIVDWPWFWVLSPLWISGILAILSLVLIGIVMVVNRLRIYMG